MRKLLAIDPGTLESAYVIVWKDCNSYEIIDKGKVSNDNMLEIVRSQGRDVEIAIEMIASYGMPVGGETFLTVLWIGRFYEASKCYDKSFSRSLIYRMEEKLHLCHSNKANDASISQALRDRFGNKGTKKQPGFFYGFSKDIWQAFAVAITYFETKQGE